MNGLDKLLDSIIEIDSNMVKNDNFAEARELLASIIANKGKVTHEELHDIITLLNNTIKNIRTNGPQK
jgi:hypothetical protein